MGQPNFGGRGVIYGPPGGVYVQGPAPDRVNGPS